MHTCKIVLVTSLVWFVFDVAVIMYYSDCSTGTGGWGCGNTNTGRDRGGPKQNVVDGGGLGAAKSKYDRGKPAEVDEGSHDLAVRIAMYHCYSYIILHLSPTVTEENLYL